LIAARQRSFVKTGVAHFEVRRFWADGQGTSPKEQNTQQSPSLGFRRCLQVVHKRSGNN
jgi:hypothetical protein